MVLSGLRTYSQISNVKTLFKLAADKHNFIRKLPLYLKLLLKMMDLIGFFSLLQNIKSAIFRI